MLRIFRGIELAVISGNGNEGFFSKMKKGFANVLSGGDFRSDYDYWSCNNCERD